MTEQELIARLRDKNCCESPNCNCDTTAGRIEALVKERDIAVGMYMRSSDEGFRQKARAEQLAATCERLEAALRVIAQYQAVTSSAMNIHAIWKMTEIARAALTQKDRTDG